MQTNELKWITYPQKNLNYFLNFELPKTIKLLEKKLEHGVR